MQLNTTDHNSLGFAGKRASLLACLFILGPRGGKRVTLFWEGGEAIFDAYQRQIKGQHHQPMCFQQHWTVRRMHHRFY